MKRKLISVLLCVSLFTAMLTGCAGSKETTTEDASGEKAAAEVTQAAAETSEEATADNAAAEERTLTFFHWRTEDKAAFEQLAKNYEEMNPGLTIEIEIVPSEDYPDTWLVRASGDEIADVFAVQPDGTFGSFIESGKLMELNDCDTIMANYNPDALSAGTRDGITYAVTQTTNPLAIYYNKAIFAQYNLEVPTTEEEFLNVCKTLKDNGVVPMAQGAGVTWMAEFMVEGILANSCDDLSVFSTGKISDEPGVLDSIKFAKQIFDNGYIMEGSSGIAEESLLTGFACGNYAMIATGTWSMATIRSISEDIDFGLFNMPGSKGTTKGVSNTGLMLGINKDTKLKDDAIGFVTYLTSADALNYFCNETGQLTVANGVSIEAEDLKMAQSLLTGPDGIVSAPFHLPNSQGLEVCQVRTQQLVIESVEPEAFLTDWQKELENTLQ